MFYKEWKPFYEEIKTDLDLNFEEDKDASSLLNFLLKDKKLEELKTLEKLIKDKELIIFGAGPSLEPSIRSKRKQIDKSIIIAADGATSALLKYDIEPDIIVSDLDGDIYDQINANLKGSLILIHAHGDNIKFIKKYVEDFQNKIIGTTQINPSDFKNLYNFGGFTDGDRAVFLADHFKAKKINLVGFDFKGKIGKYSFPENKDKKMKLMKLKWCEKLINHLMVKNKNIEFL